MGKQLKLEIHFDEAETAISVMREVAAWGRDQGYRIWPDEWLTKDELITSDAQPENFCLCSAQICRDGYDNTCDRSNPNRVPQAWYSVHPIGHGFGRKGG